MRVWLDVPFSEINDAKFKGAWFDIATKKWFVDNPVDLMLFKKWIPSLSGWDESQAEAKLNKGKKLTKKHKRNKS